MPADTTRPATGSTHATPKEAPIPAATTANDVNASLRACRPSVTNASDPMLRPTRIR
jgi:hypothetical protein